MTKFVAIKGLFCLVAVALCSADSFGQITTLNRFNNLNYQNVAPGVRYNAAKGSIHRPGVAVHKSTGTYLHRGNGYYQNPVTGNIYNPTQGTYSSGKNLEFRGGQYQTLSNGTRFNSQTGALHIPGQAVHKPSGTYIHRGNGHYVNPETGNVYNPYTRSYKSTR